MGNERPDGQPHGEPLRTNTKPFPVGSETIHKKILPLLSLTPLDVLTRDERRRVDENRGFLHVLDRYFDHYRQQTILGDLEANWAKNAYFDGALLVHRVLRTQAEDSMPFFTVTEQRNDAEVAFKTEMTALEKFAEENNRRDQEIGLIAHMRIYRLGATDNEPALRQLLLDQADKYKDKEAFLVGAMASYFTLKTTWQHKETARNQMEGEPERLSRVDELLLVPTISEVEEKQLDDAFNRVTIEVEEEKAVADAEAADARNAEKDREDDLFKFLEANLKNPN